MVSSFNFSHENLFPLRGRVQDARRAVVHFNVVSQARRFVRSEKAGLVSLRCRLHTVEKLVKFHACKTGNERSKVWGLPKFFGDLDTYDVTNGKEVCSTY